MKYTALLLALLAACGAEATGPEPITLGEDDCTLCKMIISEQPYAAEARFAGRLEKYDDIGCLGERLAAGGAPGGMWVADHGTHRWIDAAAAFYVHVKEMKTPMASGLAAFSSKADAEGFAAARQGRIVTLAEVREMRRPQ